MSLSDIIRLAMTYYVRSNFTHKKTRYMYFYYIIPSYTIHIGIKIKQQEMDYYNKKVETGNEI